MWRKGNPPTLPTGCKLVQLLWETVRSFLKKSQLEGPRDPAIPPLGIDPERKNENTAWKRSTHLHVRCSII